MSPGVPRCAVGPLGVHAPHLFTTRQLELSSAAHVRELADAVGARDVAMVTQVHGREVVVVRKGLARARASTRGRRAHFGRARHRHRRPRRRLRSAADGGSGARRRGGGARRMARHGRASGGRGGRRAWTRIRYAVPADLVAAIGPSIGACCYEVGTDLVDAFAAAGHERYLIDRWFLSPPPAARVETSGPACASTSPAPISINSFWPACPRTQIYASGLCTAMHLDVLTSYRMEKDKAGRIAGVIRMKA